MSLSAGPRHGYAIMADVEAVSGEPIGPGTLYAVLARLERRGLIEPLEMQDRRRPYRLTGDGAAALAHMSMGSSASWSRHGGVSTRHAHEPARAAVPRRLARAVRGGAPGHPRRASPHPAAAAGPGPGRGRRHLHPELAGPPSPILRGGRQDAPRATREPHDHGVRDRRGGDGPRPARSLLILQAGVALWGSRSLSRRCAWPSAGWRWAWSFGDPAGRTR
ncbi:MAG: PadR family transcriptional regulator [Chloroflexota bacterium]